MFFVKIHLFVRLDDLEKSKDENLVTFFKKSTTLTANNLKIKNGTKKNFRKIKKTEIEIVKMLK